MSEQKGVWVLKKRAAYGEGRFVCSAFLHTVLALMTDWPVSLVIQIDYFYLSLKFRASSSSSPISPFIPCFLTAKWNHHPRSCSLPHLSHHYSLSVLLNLSQICPLLSVTPTAIPVRANSASCLDLHHVSWLLSCYLIGSSSSFFTPEVSKLFSLKAQVINTISSFVSHTICVSATQPAIEGIKKKGSGIPIKLYWQTAAGFGVLARVCWGSLLYTVVSDAS